jgi:transposase InsO family protein
MSSTAVVLSKLTNSLLNFDKLTESNWATWKARITVAFKLLGVLNHVSADPASLSSEIKDEKSNPSKPAAPDDELAILAWGIIQIMVDDGQLKHIQTCATAREAWNRLVEIHEDRSLASEIGLLKQFWNCQMRASDSLQQHLDQIRDIHSKLKAINAEMDEKWVAKFILTSVPYDQFKHVTLALGSGDALTIHKVTTALLAEDKRMKMAQGQPAYNDTATAMITSSPNESKAPAASAPKHRSSVVCRYCKHIGHIETECNKKKRSQQRASQWREATPAAKPMSTANVAASNDNPPQLEEFGLALAARSMIGPTLTSQSEAAFYIDSGASEHYCGDPALLSNYIALKLTKKIQLGDGRVIEAIGFGSLRGQLQAGNTWIPIKFDRVLHVPKLAMNLISVNALVTAGYSVQFDRAACVVSRNGTSYNITRSQEQNLYPVVVRQIRSEQRAAALATSASQSAVLWHHRLGHLNVRDMAGLRSAAANFDFTGSLRGPCASCMKGKQARSPVPDKATHRATKLLQLVHTDVCGPMRTHSFTGCSYFVLFIDDASRFTFIRTIPTKDRVFQEFVAFKALVEKQTGLPIKAIRSDRGGEYNSHEFNQFLTTHGIAHQLTAPRQPEQNGVAERANRTIVEAARCMLFAANLPPVYWAAAVHAAVYTRNRVPSSATKAKTPFELWTGEKPSLSDLRVFGCKAYVHVADELRYKLDAKSAECVFIGYSLDSKAWIFYQPAKRRTLVSRNASFDERLSGISGEISSNSPAAGVSVDWEPIESEADNSAGRADPPADDSDSQSQADTSDHDADDDSAQHDDIEDDLSHSPSSSQAKPIPPSQPTGPPQSVDPAPRRSTRERIPWVPSWERRINGLLVASSSGSDDLEPRTFKEATQCSQSSKWQQAMKAEMDALAQAGTWVLTSMPPGKRAVGNKWVYRVKRDSTGNIDKFKARLVAQGFTQREGIDYGETFAPVAKFNSIRGLLALVAYHDLELHQMDVVSAYLNGDIDVEIYMKQPQGFIEPGKEDFVCRLQKTLYGLKQSGRAWYSKMDDCLAALNFTRLQSDHCVYKFDNHRVLIVVALYVDDLLIASNSLQHLERFKKGLTRRFNMKDLGEAHFVLGIQVARDRQARTLSIGQKHYVESLVARFSMDQSHPVSTPMATGSTMTAADCPNTPDQIEEMRHVPFQSAVGALMYAMTATRPDIAYTVSRLSKFTNNYGPSHWAAVKRLLRYMHGTSNYRITYGAATDRDPRLVGFCDADWGHNEGRKSISGYVFLLAGAAVSWMAKAQPTVALSSVEAEYMAAAEAAKEALWWRAFLMELGRDQLDLTTPTMINCDNQGSIVLTKNAEFHARVKHIDIRHHFLRDHVEQGRLSFTYVPTGEQAADVFTKPLPKDAHNKLVKLIGVAPGHELSGSVRVAQLSAQ